MSNFDDETDYFAVGDDPFSDDSTDKDAEAPIRVIDADYVHPDPDEDEGDAPEEDTKPTKRSRFQKGSICPKSDDGHHAVLDPSGANYICTACGKKRWTPFELEEIANKLLRDDSNAELCRFCKEKDPDSLPYGHETGHIEWQIQKDKETGEILLDDHGDALYVAFPELMCDKGHRWYKGEGPRRNINGKDAILFESHLYNRRRREIQTRDGIPDPAYTMDRWGKHPIQGLYNRSHPQGRKVNSEEARRKHGASYYR